MESSRYSHVDLDEAHSMVSDARDMRAVARRELDAHGWQWYIVWAIVCGGASLSAFTHVFAWYWLIAAPLGIVATIVVCAREDQRTGVQRDPRPYWWVGGAITVINFASSALLPGRTVVVVIWVVFGFGFVAFAWLDHQPTIAALFAALAIAIGLSGPIVPDTLTLYVVAGLVYAATMVGVAVGIRSMGTAR